MRMDGNNNRVATVAIGACVAAALAYMLPVYGYRDATAREEALRVRYQEKLRQMYSPQRPVHYNPGVGAVEVLQLKEQFNSSNCDATQHIDVAQASTRMHFPMWTNIPERDKRDPLVYFMQVLAHKKYEVRTRWNNNVPCVELPSEVFNSKNFWIW